MGEVEFVDERICEVAERNRSFEGRRILEGDSMKSKSSSFGL